MHTAGFATRTSADALVLRTSVRSTLFGPCTQVCCGLRPPWCARPPEQVTRSGCTLRASAVCKHHRTKCAKGAEYEQDINIYTANRGPKGRVRCLHKATLGCGRLSRVATCGRPPPSGRAALALRRRNENRRIEASIESDTMMIHDALKSRYMHAFLGSGSMQNVSFLLSPVLCPTAPGNECSVLVHVGNVP